MPLPINPETRNRVIAIAIVAACAVSVASQRPWHGSVRGLAIAAARPAHVLLAAAHDGLVRALRRARGLWNASDELERLRAENRALREALARHDDEIRQAQVALRSVEGFRDYRARCPVRAMTVLAAQVLAADPSPWRHYLIVNRGQADGVREGAAAAWGGSIVGTVVDLRAHAATVRLLTDPRAGLTVRVARTGDVGLLRGAAQRDGRLDLKWIHLQPIQAGDTVVTADRDPVIPPGLIAGRIVEASPTRQPLFYKADVRPLLDLSRLTELILVSCAPDDVDELLDRQQPPGDR